MSSLTVPAVVPQFSVGDRVFVYMPAAKACKAYKFTRPFNGPNRIIEQSNSGVLVDQWIELTWNQSELRTIKFVNALKKFLISFGQIILRSGELITKKLILGHPI